VILSGILRIWCARKLKRRSNQSPISFPSFHYTFPTSDATIPATIMQSKYRIQMVLWEKHSYFTRCCSPSYLCLDLCCNYHSDALSLLSSISHFSVVITCHWVPSLISCQCTIAAGYLPIQLSLTHSKKHRIQLQLSLLSYPLRSPRWPRCPVHDTKLTTFSLPFFTTRSTWSFCIQYIIPTAWYQSKLSWRRQTVYKVSHGKQEHWRNEGS